jgi:hypothetical protein
MTSQTASEIAPSLDGLRLSRLSWPADVDVLCLPRPVHATNLHCPAPRRFVSAAVINLRNNVRFLSNIVQMASTPGFDGVLRKVVRQPKGSPERLIRVDTCVSKEFPLERRANLVNLLVLPVAERDAMLAP